MTVAEDTMFGIAVGNRRRAEGAETAGLALVVALTRQRRYSAELEDQVASLKARAEAAEAQVKLDAERAQAQLRAAAVAAESRLERYAVATHAGHVCTVDQANKAIQELKEHSRVLAERLDAMVKLYKTSTTQSSQRITALQRSLTVEQATSDALRQLANELCQDHPDQTLAMESGQTYQDAARQGMAKSNLAVRFEALFDQNATSQGIENPSTYR